MKNSIGYRSLLFDHWMPSQKERKFIEYALIVEKNSVTMASANNCKRIHQDLFRRRPLFASSLVGRADLDDLINAVGKNKYINHLIKISPR